MRNGSHEAPDKNSKPTVDIVIRFGKLENKYARQALDELQGSMTYPVYVDYSLPLEQLIAKGAYTEALPYVNSQNFPPLAKENDWLPIKFIRFTEAVSHPGKIFLGLGLENIDAQTLISLGNQHPDVQRNQVIGALGQPHEDFMQDIVILQGDANSRSVRYRPSLGQVQEGIYYAVRPIWQSIRR